MKVDLSKNRIDYEATGSEHQYLHNTEKWYEHLHSGKEAFTGWVKLPYEFDQDLLVNIEDTAEKIKKQCSLIIVVGIGGSYLGAKALNDALNGSRPGWPALKFAGYNMSAAYMDKLVKQLENQSTCMIVISKSGRTVESLLSYSILKEKMFAKYGYEEARKRIYVITDAHKGDLHQEAFENGYKSFVVPDDIGGRYSVLSVVGMLPVAAAGHNIREILAGAAEIAKSNEWKEKMIQYAAGRNLLYKEGKVIEVFEYFDVNLRYFGEWLTQLFGESEGKEGKGIFPSCLCFTRDLHSMGQFLQQGKKIFFETMIRISESDYDFDIPWHAGYPYAGKTLEQINDCAEQGVIIAHEKGGIPMNLMQIERLDEYNMGALIYFFEMSCAMSAYLMGVNPFDQPGVEDYKKEMKNLVIEADEK